MTITHPRRGDAEYVLTIECHDHDAAVTIDHLGWWPTPPGAAGFMNWLCARGSIQTPFGEKMDAELRAGASLGLVGGAPVDLGGWAGTPRGMNHEYRFRFECPECGHTVPVTGARFMPILDRLRLARITSLSLAVISYNL